MTSYRRQRLEEAMRGLRFDSGTVELAPGWPQVLAERGGNADAAALRQRGREHLKGNVPVEAIETFKLAVLRKPNDPDGYDDLGRALAGAQQTDAAISAFQSALQTDPMRHDTRFSLAMARWRKRDLTQAEEQLRELMLRDPDNGRAQGRLAILLYYRQRYAESWHYVHEAESRGHKLPAQFRPLLEKKMPEPGD